MATSLDLHASSRRMGMKMLRLAALAAPAVLLGIASLREAVVHGYATAALVLALGASLEAIGVGVLVLSRRTWAPSLGPTALACYLTGLGWLWFSMTFVSPRAQMDWYGHLALALLIVVPLGMVAVYTVLQSGAPVFQRARKLAQQLSKPGTLPSTLTTCRDLPEVKAFRESLILDAGPALQLLAHARPEVRICALGALEFRQQWRPGQAERVLSLLQREEVPEVRAAAVSALANIDDRQMLEVVANSLRDPDPGVRRAAAMALFWNSERRWSWIRFGVRRALGEPALADDGPLLRDGEKLSPEAVDDLIAWAAEKGVLSARSAQTLAVHYARVLHELPDETLPTLYGLVNDMHAAPLLRIEMAKVLHANRLLAPKMLEGLLDPANPAPLRLIAAEALLDSGPHTGAVNGLREIARLPNRELALGTADVVQRRLGVDLGLAIGQPLPPLHSPKAIEITRRLMAWAARRDVSENVLDAPSPAPLRHLTN